jgi:hypothetical protein
MVRRREADGSMSDEREEMMPTEAETYAGKHREAIIDALNVLGCWHSPLSHLKKGSKEWEALLGEDYEWREAMSILYGALGINMDKGAEKAYRAYEKIRDAEWARSDEPVG